MTRSARATAPLLITLPALLALSACGSAGQVTPAGESASNEVLVSQVARAQVAVAEASSAPQVVSAADVLGLQLIAEQPDTTVVTSPASLQIALSMAADGAEDQTLTELEALIGAEGADRGEAINALTAALEDLDGDPAVVQEEDLPSAPVVHRATRIVLDDELEVKQDYVDLLSQNYGAPAELTDLNDPESAEVLNSWVDEQTGGLVPESAIKPSPTLRLVLQDAIVLAAQWEAPFSASLTDSRDFTLADGSQVAVDMMTTGESQNMRYTEADGWQAVRLPYSGGRLHADIILPPEGTAAPDVTPEVLQEVQSGLDDTQWERVVFSMPIVHTKTKLDLKPFLTEHAPAALSGGFGGIADADLLIEQAAQQAVLAIDEEGTVAAAVTEIGIGESAVDAVPIELTVDRPYLVRIADAETGWPLFLAHIANPS